MENLQTKKIWEIAETVQRDWKNLSPYAAPYVSAMHEMETIDENYYCDSGKSIILYFLSNAQSWRGETAKAIKQELKRRAGIK